MGFFPFYIDIAHKNCLVVGGGTVALRKVEKLAPFKPRIKVVAPKICDEIKNIHNVHCVEREFENFDLNLAFMVIIATNDKDLNSRIYDLCVRRNILVNTVDDRKKCDFIFPALVKTENLTIGISTEGKSPIYARFVREKIENSLGDDCDEVIQILSDVRSYIKREIPTEEKRKQAFERILRLCVEDRTSVTNERIFEIVEELKREN